MRSFSLLACISALAFASYPSGAQTAGANGQIAEINGAQIHYQVFGEGQPVVLIHGCPLSGDLYQEQVEVLSERYQVHRSGPARIRR